MLTAPKRLSSFSKLQSKVSCSSSLRKVYTNEDLSYNLPLNNMYHTSTNNKENVFDLNEEIKETKDSETEEETKNNVNTIIYDPVEKGIGENISELIINDNDENSNNGFLNWFCCGKNNNDFEKNSPMRSCSIF